jgi:aryl-alcohol dehydrogenase-like predicted oxidoreductase
MITRKFWDGAKRPALGLGCWAIGGPWTAGGMPAGWGVVDDAESVRAIHLAVEAGIRFFDTAQAYGAGHSEAVLGQALQGRDDVLIATKVGLVIDPARSEVTGQDITQLRSQPASMPHCGACGADGSILCFCI